MTLRFTSFLQSSGVAY